MPTEPSVAMIWYSAKPAELKRSLELIAGLDVEHSLALSQPDREERGWA